jgi:hypothetical protein
MLVGRTRAPGGPVPGRPGAAPSRPLRRAARPISGFGCPHITRTRGNGNPRVDGTARVRRGPAGRRRCTPSTFRAGPVEAANPAELPHAQSTGRPAARISEKPLPAWGFSLRPSEKSLRGNRPRVPLARGPDARKSEMRDQMDSGGGTRRRSVPRPSPGLDPIPLPPARLPRRTRDRRGRRMEDRCWMGDSAAPPAPAVTARPRRGTSRPGGIKTRPSPGSIGRGTRGFGRAIATGVDQRLQIGSVSGPGGGGRPWRSGPAPRGCRPRPDGGPTLRGGCRSASTPPSAWRR